VDANIQIRTGPLISAIQEEMKTEAYDLLVLGAPLPNAYGKVDLHGTIGTILNAVENCSFLIIRSRQFQRLQNRFRRNL
jgi:hypothetical protein